MINTKSISSHGCLSDSFVGRKIDVKSSKWSNYTGLNLEKYRLKTLAPSLYYIPEFITFEKEQSLISRIQSHPESDWSRSTKQNKQEWGWFVRADGKIEQTGKKVPNWASSTIELITAVNDGYVDLGRPGFLRVNEYPVGLGIHPHVDVDVPGSSNAILTLNSTALLDFYDPKAEEKEGAELEQYHIGSVLMEPRSLLLVSKEMFYHLHGIKSMTYDLITHKVLNRPENLPIGTVLERGLRYSLALTKEGCGGSG